MISVSADAAVIALGVIDATLVALFFLFRVLPWSTPGPWRLIWVFATLTSLLFIVGEVAAASIGGEAMSIAHQGPLFAAILCASTCFILAYLHGPRSVAAARERQSAELRSRTEYMSIVAHELRNPLIAIGAAARVLARHGEAASTAAGIADEARAALSLLDGLTDLASIESGRLVSALRPLDLAAAVRETVRSSRPADRPVELRGGDAPLLVLGDERRIAEVLRNLLGNAVKYAPSGPIEVTAGFSTDRRSAVVSVRDFGPGVPPAERSRLFQKFTRLSTAAATRGSGLGLYVCREIVRDHGGELTADWPGGGGSIFSFTLPLVHGLVDNPSAGPKARSG